MELPNIILEKNDFNFYGHNLEDHWDSFTYHLQTDSEQKPMVCY